jgi:hypothetical protein
MGSEHGVPLDSVKLQVEDDIWQLFIFKEFCLEDIFYFFTKNQNRELLYKTPRDALTLNATFTFLDTSFFFPDIFLSTF